VAGAASSRGLVYLATREGFAMDAHYSEYLAAIAGMQDCYGASEDGALTEFHDTDVPTDAAADSVPV
jgi:hypothetical protein